MIPTWALDVLGFSQFKWAYEAVMQEQAHVNAEKISQGEFLMVIECPWHKAFTPENVWKSFEVTGTWPVDQSKITSDKIAPAVGFQSLGGLLLSWHHLLRHSSIDWEQLGS